MAARALLALFRPLPEDHPDDAEAGALLVADGLHALRFLRLAHSKR